MIDLPIDIVIPEVLAGLRGGAGVVLVLLVDHMLALVEAWKDFADLGKET